MHNPIVPGRKSIQHSECIKALWLRFLSGFLICTTSWYAPSALGTLTASDLSAFANSQAPVIEKFLDRAKQIDLQNIHLVPTYQAICIHSDPLACRNCRGASWRLILELKARYPDSRWILFETSDYHFYIFNQDLDLIVDPTYRQYFIHLSQEEFIRLPRIFVGTAKDFRTFALKHISEDSIEHYLTTVGADKFANLDSRLRPYLDQDSSIQRLCRFLLTKIGWNNR